MNDKIADDILRGVKAIAAEIGLSERQTYYKLEQGHIPAGKDGDTWVASRETLRGYYRKITAGATATPSNAHAV